MKNDVWFRMPAPWTFTTREGARQLLCMIQSTPFGFMSVALETFSELPVAASGNLLKAAESVFDDHSHKIIGKHKSVVNAKKAVAKYVHKWRKTHAAEALPACKCSEIRAVAR